MDNFDISPSDCLIVKAIQESKSLRDAATILKIDPAGLVRKVQNIAKKDQLLKKVNNRWQVTPRGIDLIAWMETSILSQRKILSKKETLRLASTMWFSEEVLIPSISSLQKKINKDTNIEISVPDDNFESCLMDGSIDFVITCHPPEFPEIKHKQITFEKWSLIYPSSWKNIKAHNFVKSLEDRPFIRHNDINEDVFLPHFDNLNYSPLKINNLVGIRSAVKNGLGWSLTPKIVVRSSLKEGSIKEIPYDLPLKDRKVCLWWLRNRGELQQLEQKLTQWLKSCDL